MKFLSRIYFNEYQFEFARSGGPGGQHVNKTNSAAVLRWNVLSTQSFSEEEKSILLQKLPLTKDGDILIRSEEFRNQEQNKSKCLEKLDQLLEKAFFKPKKRKKTKPTRASRERRHTSKRKRSEIKKLRNKKDY